MPALLRNVIASVAMVLILGCASLQPRDPLNVTVAGIEPLQGQGLEMRMNVKLRVQNPNDAPVEYKGVAVEMDLQGKTFATGVTNATGTVPGFGETVIDVPVTISAYRMLRQAVGMMSGGPVEKIEFEMRGKLSRGGWSANRFATKRPIRPSPGPGQRDELTSPVRNVTVLSGRNSTADANELLAKTHPYPDSKLKVRSRIYAARQTRQISALFL